MKWFSQHLKKRISANPTKSNPKLKTLSERKTKNRHRDNVQYRLLPPPGKSGPQGEEAPPKSLACTSGGPVSPRSTRVSVRAGLGILHWTVEHSQILHRVATGQEAEDSQVDPSSPPCSPQNRCPAEVSSRAPTPADTAGGGLEQHCSRAFCPAHGHRWAEHPGAGTEPGPVQKQAQRLRSLSPRCLPRA